MRNLILDLVGKGYVAGEKAIFSTECISYVVSSTVAPDLFRPDISH